MTTSNLPWMLGPWIRVHYPCILRLLRSLRFMVLSSNCAATLLWSRNDKKKKKATCCINSNVYCVDHCCCFCLVTKSCLTLCDLMDCSPSGSSVHGISQARILEWVAIPFSRGSYWLRHRTHVSCISCIGRWILYHYATWEALIVSVFTNKSVL